MCWENHQTAVSFPAALSDVVQMPSAPLSDGLYIIVIQSQTRDVVVTVELVPKAVACIIYVFLHCCVLRLCIWGWGDSNTAASLPFPWDVLGCYPQGTGRIQIQYLRPVQPLWFCEKLQVKTAYFYCNQVEIEEITRYSHRSSTDPEVLQALISNYFGQQMDTESRNRWTAPRQVDSEIK